MKRLLPKSEFGRNVVTLMTGTVIAQAIPIAIAPILTRLYSPEEFGLFALYMGIASMLSVIVTGRYEQAIMLPVEDNDAFNLVALSLTLTSIISLIVLIVIFYTKSQVATALEKSEIENWLFIIPATIFLTGVWQTLNCWGNRKKRYKTMAYSRVHQNFSMSASHIGLGFFSGSGIFLVVGDLIGRFVSSVFLTQKTWQEDHFLLEKTNPKQQFRLARRYKKFPIFDTSATLANVSAYQIQNILFPIFYGLSSAGFYFLVLRVLQAPLSLIGASLTDVFKQKLTDKKTTEKDLKKYYKKMFVFLFSIGIFPFILFMLKGKELFVFIFGAEWKVAGEYAIILAPMFFIRFIASPLSYLLYSKEKQEVNILLQFLFLFHASLSFLLTKDIENTIVAISILFSTNYILYIIYSAKLAKVI